jgi:hypothetical protein
MRTAIKFNRTQLLRICFILLTGFSLFPCAAQEGQTVALKFVSFPKTTDPEPLELLVGEGRTIKVDAPSYDISKPHAVTSQGVWRIGKTVKGEDGKSKFEVYGETKALQSSKQLLLLIRKGRTNAEGFKIIAFDSQDTQFGGEKFLFLNGSKVEIAGVIGNSKFALKPGTHIIIRPEVVHGERKNLCHVSFAYSRDEKWKPFSSTVWPVSKDARSLVFFYHDPQSSKLSLHTIQDVL